MTYFRVYMKGSYVGIGIRAERMEVSHPSLMFWQPGGAFACFWLEDVEKVRDVNDNLVPLVAEGQEVAA